MIKISGVLSSPYGYITVCEDITTQTVAYENGMGPCDEVILCQKYSNGHPIDNGKLRGVKWSHTVPEHWINQRISS